MFKHSRKKVKNLGVTIALLLLAALFELAPGSASTEMLNLPLASDAQVTASPKFTATPNTTNAASVATRPTVTKVADGDTFTVTFPDGKVETVRLLGVDTPESVDPRKTVQCFGKEASAFTKEKLFGKEVRLEGDPTQGDVDRYNRLLRYVYLSDDSFFNLLLLQEGYATEYTYQKPYQFQKTFQAAQASAKLDQKGFWNQASCNGKR
jgi:micrococcal nuclease